jgi:phage regulator Rha-like protein
MITMDELLALPRVDSRDVADVFDVPHGLVMAEIDERRGDPAYDDAVYCERWEQHPDGCRMRHFEMDRAGLAWLVLQWPMPAVVEFKRACEHGSRRPAGGLRGLH